MKKILITGCSGLVGIHLVNKSLEKGYEVYGVDMKESKHLPKNSNFKFQKINLLESGQIENLIHNIKPDVVFNSFGIKGSPLRAKNQPVDFLYPSFKINTEIINQCSKNNIWLVFVSSVGVYSPAEKFIESDVWKTLPSESDWFPSWSKRMGEILLEAYKVQYGYTNWSIIRPANIFGEYDDFSGNGTVVASQCKKIYESNGEVIAWGDGSPIRDFVYAGDVADAIIQLYESSLNTIVNFGSGEEISIKSMIDELIKISGKDLNVVWDLTKPNGDLRRQMDITKQKEINLLPKLGFKESLNLTYEFYKKEIEKMKIVKQGYHVGNLHDYTLPNNLKTLKSYIDYIKQYANDKNNLKYRYDFSGEGLEIDYNVFEHSIKQDLIKERDELVKTNNYHIVQRWWDFHIHEQNVNKYFYDLSVKIASNLYTQYDFTSDDFDSIGSFSLFENDDFIEIHRDGFMPDRLCVVIIYLSDNWKEGDGGELVIIDKEKISIEPLFDKFVVLDFIENNLEHEVLKVNNDFKRFAYVHFLNFKQQNTDTYKQFRRDKK